MKNFLVRVEIRDGEHEHYSWGLVRAENIDEATKIAEAQIEVDNNPTEENEGSNYWGYEDDSMGVSFEEIRELECDQEHNLIKKFGFASFIN